MKKYYLPLTTFQRAIKLSFDAEVAKKFLNGIYYECAYMLESIFQGLLKVNWG